MNTEEKTYGQNTTETHANVDQRVAILVDGNNIGKSVWSLANNETMLDYDLLIPDLLRDRTLTRLIYFREGKSISSRFERRLKSKFFGSVMPAGRNAVIPIAIKAMQLAEKVDTIILMSGNDDFVELSVHLRNNGLRVEVASLDHSTSSRLKAECDDWYNIDDRYFFTIAPRPTEGAYQESGTSSSMVINEIRQEDLYNG